MKKLFQIASFFFLATGLLWLVVPNRSFIQGLLLGMAVSLINGVILFMKTYQLGKYMNQGKRRIGGMGMMQRMLLAGFAVYVSVKRPELFSLAGVLIGLFLIQILTLLLSFRITRFTHKN
ncbi:ATP synthase subunit I [Microaerobacter geothermalis]|nr:ATP synthase subunit I [Microaerobacter geothermalis]